MTSYSFYQVNNSPIDKILPNLLFKIYETLKKPMLFHVESDNISKYDQLFWSFSTNKFLPHATLNKSPDHYRYLLISDKLENSNNAEILIALDEIPEEFTENFKKTIYLFHHSHPHAQKFLDKYHSEKQVKPKNTKFHNQDQKGKWQTL